MRATRGRTPTLRSPRSPRASRSGAGRRQRWWARTGGLIAGHARVLAARQLGIGEIPVMVAKGWSEAQKRAYVLADNQLAITGSGWDPELLRLELGEIKLAGFDLSLTGFGDIELKPTLPLRQRARAHARESQPRIKAVACRQGRAVGDRSADPVCAQRADAHRRSDRRDRREHQGVGLDVASAGGRGRGA